MFSVGHDGGALTRVTTGGGHGAFALSPDGKQLAIYDHEHDHLVLQPASGAAPPSCSSTTCRATCRARACGWPGRRTARRSPSPPSSDRARTPYPPGSALYVVNADGSGLSVVPNTGKVWDPAWRPE